jgi:Melibiase
VLGEPTSMISHTLIKKIGYIITFFTLNSLLLIPVTHAQAAPPAPVTTYGEIVESKDGSRYATIGNATAHRTIVFGNKSGAYTDSLNNKVTKSEYIGASNIEFSFVLSNEVSKGEEEIELDSNDMVITNLKWVEQTRQRHLLEATFSGTFQNEKITLFLYYEALANQNFLRKWFVIAPFYAPGWAIQKATTENFIPHADLTPIIPKQRYAVTFPNGKPDYNKYEQIMLDEPEVRFELAEKSNEVGQHKNNAEGFYFFSASLFGEENFDQTAGLVLANDDFSEPLQGFVSGIAVLGFWQGPTDIGFKRYREYIANHYAVGKGKRDPVWFSTWYPYESGINEGLMYETLDQMKQLGFYDMLHIDAGWQVGAPLEVNPDRFPNGLDPIIGRLRSDNLSLGLWMNPFSSSYENLEGYQEFRNLHPDWIDVNTEKRICPLSGAGKYVRDRLIEIATKYPLDEIYWDGADWYIVDCQSLDSGWRTYHEERIKMLRFYASILDEIHRLRPQFRVVIWSAPPDIHWLKVADQVQFSDVDNAPIMQSELVRRQQLYNTSFTFPHFSVWGDYYGLGYRRKWEDGIGQPLPITQYALASTISNGGTQAGGSIDLRVTPPGLKDFMKVLFEWRKRFEKYFSDYQHILGFPDGKNIDGAAHLINGQGFIMLYNHNTDKAETIELPLDEPSLEFNPYALYTLSDWSDLKSGTTFGLYSPTQKPLITVPPLGWRIIGVNINP